MRAFVRSKKYWILGVVVIIALCAWYIRSTSSGVPAGITIEPVTRGEVDEVVSETGSVVAVQEVDLAFERGGKVSEIPVTKGSVVSVGDVLMRLDSDEQLADLASAKARLSAEQLRLDELIRGADSASLAVTESSVESVKTAYENAKENLAKVIAQQDTLLKNARTTLRSADLQAYLVGQEREGSTRSYTPPTISGTYESEEEGVYHIALYSSAAPSGSSYIVSGLENDTQSVSTVNTTILGTRGLYIQFPDNFAPRTEWEVPIPNTRSSSYLTNLNTYNAVREARDVAIANAESGVKAAEAALVESQFKLTQVSGSARSERVAAQRALVEQMQAAVLVAEALYGSMTITAPFGGTVTAVNAEIGEVVSPGVPMVSLISDSNLELVVNISESNIRELTIGDSATVVFDAYNGVTVQAHVTSISPNAVIVDGVRVFEVRLQFDEKNELARAGLSATIDILAASRENVIAIPSRAVIEKDGAKFVRSLVGNTLKYLPVTVGLRGSNGMTEITEGLTEGQEIVTFAEANAIKQLETQ